ncbi:down syndrome cell adhesion molecule [Caerostris darwini]|uniref:Down syndrome cell adhesion molecule n=1 Tax=Caerostris darwini TaxID=1538125 RepID=A0AAV4Q4H1_9ARAC|nr:down syndrome cell adhesion molecule [Caerostris darwini]
MVFFLPVIKQRFDPQVYDDFVVRGNTAVLRCHLPTFVREYVAVDSWIRDDKQVLKRNDMKANPSKSTPAKRSSLIEPTFSVLLPSFKNNLLATPFHFLLPSELTGTATREFPSTPARTSSLTEATFSVLLPSSKNKLLDTPFHFLPPSELAATATSPSGDAATVFWGPPGGSEWWLMVNGIAVSLPSPTHRVMRIDGGSVFVLV